MITQPEARGESAFDPILIPVADSVSPFDSLRSDFATLVAQTVSLPQVVLHFFFSIVNVVNLVNLCHLFHFFHPSIDTYAIVFIYFPLHLLYFTYLPLEISHAATIHSYPSHLACHLSYNPIQ